MSHKIMNLIRLSSAVLLLSSSFSAALWAALPSGFYPSSSRLATGRWVRIETGETGLYEISYDRLRAMGFDAPEKVGVFGRGGRQMPENFTDENGVPAVSPDVTPVPALHLGDRMIFYGLGVEEIVPEPDNVATFPDSWHYARPTRNPYSLTGHYLLSDSGRTDMTVRQEAPDAQLTLSYGLDYWYHEQDLTWNPTRTGRVAYGEDIRPSVCPKLSIPYSLPLAVTGTNVRLAYELYRHPDYTGDVYFSINSGSASSFGALRTPDVFAPAAYAFSSKQLDRTEGQINVDNRSTTASTAYFNLDYLLMTYRKRIARPEVQERYLFPQLSAGAAGRFSLPDATDLLAVDVSDPQAPSVIRPEDNAFTIACSGRVAEIILFDSQAPLLTPGDWSEVENTDLHARAAEGAELLVITVPALMSGAERIADIHRRYDGIRVIVATTTEIYNEFGDGTPDPMACRNLVRMLYDNPSCSLRNVLLLGPLRADARCLESDAAPDSFIIAWQDPTAVTTLSSGCPNVNDWLGIMEDYSAAPTKERTISVGVGILPCLTETETDLVIDKIERFYTDPAMASRLNRYVGVGGIGDQQLHAQFAIAAARHYSNRTGGAVLTHPVIQDAYTLDDSRQRFAECLNSGPLMASYFGHGSFDQLGNRFFSISHLPMLRGSSLPFMVFAGCTLSNTDRGVRGIGEKMILSTRFGLLGGIVSTRVSTAFSNRTFVQSIYESIYCHNPMDNVLVRREEPLTLGEIFALAKSSVSEDVEGAYQLMADPALRLPFPTLDVLPDAAALSGTAGHAITLSGCVAAPNGIVREDFCGEAVIRIVAPEVKVLTLNVQSGESARTEVPYGDRTLHSVAARVENGRFSADVLLPFSLGDIEGQTATVFISAYDPDSRLGAAGTAALTIDGADRDASSEDVVPPVVEVFEYDAERAEFTITVSDETALDMSEGCVTEASSFRVDGHRQPQADTAPKILDADRSAYTKRFRINGFADGRHTAEFTARDAAGNTAVAQLVFNVAPEEGSLGLEADVKALNSSVRLSVVGSRSSAEKTLIVFDSAGLERARFDFDGDSFEWDGTDGVSRLPAAVYTLVVQDSDGAHSRPLRMPLL